MNNEIIKKPQDYTMYTGKVKIKVYCDNNLYYSEDNHNKGLNTLFAFISNCLQGNWTEARSLRPTSVILLRKDDDEDLTESTPTNIETNYWGQNCVISPQIFYDTAVVNNSSTEGNQTVSEVTYHFRIPFLTLVGGAEIQKLLLVPTNYIGDPRDACAYFILENSINIPTSGGNWTVIIDWTLTFKNTEAN